MSSRTQPVLDGRTAATLAVADALGGKRFGHDALADFRSQGRLSAREAALATEITLGTLRHILTLDHILAAVARYDRQRVTRPLRATLACGTYQIVFMDRVPVFAAVDRAVSIARRHVSGKAAGMVNAVLRRLAGAIAERRTTWQRLHAGQIRVSWSEACAFDRAVLPAPDADLAAYLAAATGEWPDRFRELVDRHGMEAAEAIAWASQSVPAIVLQRNPRRATPEAFQRGLSVGVPESAIEFADDAAFAAPSVPAIDTPAFQDGLAYVQDMTAHAAVAAVEARPDETVLDLCAAPGGKSVALAIAMEDRGKVVACDADARRLARVDANVARMGLRCIHTRLLTREAPHPAPAPASFDAVLVDVPCSNTGVIARRPEARLGLTPDKLHSLVAVQRELIREAAANVRPGGRLVYSTCSIEPAENEEIVREFIGEFPGWEVEVERRQLPAWGPRLADWRDGGYAARLRPPAQAT